MMSLYEQSKWRFGVDIKGFRLVDEAELPYEKGRPLDCPEDHPAHDRAKKFIVELAEMYRLETISIEEINIEKKKCYKEFEKNNAVFKPPRGNNSVKQKKARCGCWRSRADAEAWVIARREDVTAT